MHIYVCARADFCLFCVYQYQVSGIRAFFFVTVQVGHCMALRGCIVRLLSFCSTCDRSGRPLYGSTWMYSPPSLLLFARITAWSVAFSTVLVAQGMELHGCIVRFRMFSFGIIAWTVDFFDRVVGQCMDLHFFRLASVWSLSKSLHVQHVHHVCIYIYIYTYMYIYIYI